MPPKMGVSNETCWACGAAKYVIVDMCELHVIDEHGERTVYNVALVCPRCQDKRSQRLV